MSYSEEQITDLMDSVPCRASQINILLSLIGQRKDRACPSIFIYGHTSSGKSFTVTSLLQKLQLPHAIVNCVEQYNGKLQYEHILSCLSRTTSTSLPRCDNMNDFIRHFSHMLTQCDETFYVVLDRAERLRDMEMNLLPAYTRLQELTGGDVSVLLLSEIVWDKFSSSAGIAQPFCIHFNDYTRDELIEILMLHRPTTFSPSFYNTYINLVLSVFYMTCRDLSELAHLARIHFPKFIEPIEKDGVSPDDTKRLWTKIEPHLRKALRTVYLREISSTKWEQWMKDEDSEIPKGLTSRLHIDMPFYTKYLLIASYLASYNPAKSDRRFFSKNSAKVSAREKLVKKHERTSNQLLGPKVFPLDRLFAIFYSIVEGRVPPSANIYTQISSLVTLQFLARHSEDQLESPKYKCLVTLDFIQSVARTVNFDILRYLYDFI